MKDVHQGIISILTNAESLDGMQQLLKDAVNYVNAKHDGGGHEIRFEWLEDIENFRFTKSSFRSIEGKDHTMMVMDIDTYPEVETRQLLKREEVRELQLKAVMKIQEEILEIDDRFFLYLSGKGGYMIRKVTPSISKRHFVGVISKMLPKCNHDDHGDSVADYCELWRRKSGKRRSFFKWTTVEGHKIMVAIDLSLLEKDGVHVFRLPYSIYPKFAGRLFICSPIIFSEKNKIDVDATIKNTDPRYTELRDFEIPVEIVHEDEIEGIVVEHEAVKSTADKRMSYTNIEMSLDIPVTEDEITPIHLNVVNQIEYTLTGDVEETPPCMKNAYENRMPDDHWSRVLFSRYLLHKGFSLSEIGTFIRMKVNDAEDNSPENIHQMERNIKIFLAPTGDNPRLVPSCSKIQNPGGTFYACTPEDASKCSRRHPLQSMKKSKSYQRKQKAKRDDHIIESGKGKVSDYGKFQKIVDDVGELLDDPMPVLVKKTTRAGLTTSLVVSCKKRGKRLLVLEPTNRIAKKTFPEAVEIAKDIYEVDVNGAVMSSNPKGCLKLSIKLQQLEEERQRRLTNNEKWGEDFVALETMPVLLKPPCVTSKGECEFFDNVFDTNEDDVVIDSLVTSTEGNGDGKCARITVLRHLDEFNTIFATYAKIMASLSNDSDEAMIALSELKNYDVIMLDEISTLLDGQPQVIQIAGRRGDKTNIKSDAIRDQLAFVVSNMNNSSLIVELVETGLEALEESAGALDMEFIRNGVRTIIVQNPLSDEQKEKVMRAYAIIQNIVEKTNVNLRLLGSFMLAMNDEEWYMTAVTNTYSYTTISMVTKPELTLIRQFLAEMQRLGKKIVVTDASLPPMSMEALLQIPEWTEMNLGDPRGTNDMQLVIPDTKKVTISKMQRDKEVQQRAINFAEKVIEKHGQEDVILVAPNIRVYDMFENLRTKYPDMQMTYFRSDVTVGVSSERRTMVVFCKPLPPEDAFHWLAVHYNREQGSDVRGMSALLREHSARQTFYQTIGRVKDPKAVTPSVVYTFGLRERDIRKLIGDFDPPNVLKKTIPNSDLKILSGSHFRRTAEILPIEVLAAVDVIHDTPKKMISYARLKRLLSEKNLKFLLANLSIFNLEFLKEEAVIRANI